MDLNVLSPGCCPPLREPAPLASDSQQRIVTVFRALGDPTRLEIFRLIAAQSDPLCVCDVVSQFEVTQPTISHHLKVLREAGLVTVSRSGTWAYYAADPRGLDVLHSLARQLNLPEVSAVS
jgi:ArsR family transcriptional regulator, arsenate/arsenite/antimonite-responsive transcriptional repressor